MHLLCKTNGIHFIPLLVPEVESAFVKTDEEFLAQYGFPKPAKDATNVVIGCRSGRRAATAIGMLEKLGYNSLMYVFVINFFIKISYKGNIVLHRIYKGSFLDWVANGGPITKG